MTTPDQTVTIETTTVSITSAAADIVRDLLHQRNLDENSYGLRVFISGQGCSGFQYGMGFENQPAETDKVFECEGLKVIVDENSLEYMSGSTITYIEDERGQGFLVENPNATPPCSCGGSCSCSTSAN